MALFLEQAHIGVNAADHVLHMAALLAQIAHKQALFLKHNLELLELALLFAHAVLRKLQLGSALLGATLQVVPLRLRERQLVNGRNLRKLGSAREDNSLYLRGAIDLTLPAVAADERFPY